MGGPQQGFWGELKRSILWRAGKKAVYAPKLPISRLVSTQELNHDGWTVTLGPQIKTLTRGRTEIALGLTPSGLPYLQDLQLDQGDSAEVEAYAAKVKEKLLEQDDDEETCSTDPGLGDSTSGEEDADELYCTPAPAPKENRNEKDTKNQKEENKQQLEEEEEKEEIGRSKPKRALKSRKERFLDHCRSGHFGRARDFGCVACFENKSKRKGHRKERPGRYEVPPPTLLSTDFFGPLPVSYRGAKYVMVWVCAGCKYQVLRPIKSKADAPLVLEQVVTDIRRMRGADVKTGASCQRPLKILLGVRSDNEAALRSELWEQTCVRLGISHLCSTPYHPEANGTAERAVRTAKEHLRALLRKSDAKLWCFGVDYLQQCYNERKGKDGLSPIERIRPLIGNPLAAMRGFDKVERHGRRFGCLAFSAVLPAPTGALSPKREPGVFLGFSALSSSFLVGRLDASGRLAVKETRDCVFFEEIMVSDLRLLASGQYSDLAELQALQRQPKNDRGHGAGEAALLPEGKAYHFAAGKPVVAGKPSTTLRTAAAPDLEVSAGTLKREGGEASASPPAKKPRKEAGESLENPTLEQALADPKDSSKDGPKAASAADDRQLENLKNLLKEAESCKPPTPTTTARYAAQLTQNSSSLRQLEKDKENNFLSYTDKPSTGTFELPQEDDDDPNAKSSTPEHTSGSLLKTGATQTQVPDLASGVELGPPLLKRGRGRPKGSKDKAPRKKRGEAKKKRELEDLLQTFLAGVDEEPGSAGHTYEKKKKKKKEDQSDASDWSEGEEPLPGKPIEVFLSSGSLEAETVSFGSVKASVAMNPDSPDYVSWVTADEEERTKLVAYQCWRKLTPEEEEAWKKREISATPCACIYSRKRSGKYKARLVVLGNRWRSEEPAETYAGTVSATANRTALVHAAAHGWYLSGFDVSNAFIRAEIDRLTLVSLPKHWREGPNDSGVRALRKALYGLPISPRLWARRIRSDLIALGWEASECNPGVYRLRCSRDGHVKCVLTLYVDDALLVAENEDDLKKETARVNAVHPVVELTAGRAEGPGGVTGQTLDLLGVTVTYFREQKRLVLNQKEFCLAILKIHNLQDCKTRPTPHFEASDLYKTDAQPRNFELRKLTGSLQWLVSQTRPDLAACVSALSRVTHLPTTDATWSCCKKVLAYIRGTLDWGLEYSPEEEARFRKLYSTLAEHSLNKQVQGAPALLRHDLQAFADASFASCTQTMRSTSGLIIYYKGCPVGWKSSRQSLVAGSAFEAEFVAQNDLLTLTSESESLVRFLLGQDELGQTQPGPLWCDNSSAVSTIRKTDPEDLRKSSRHVAIRLAKLREEGAERALFCPTDMMRADALTKTSSMLERVYRGVLSCQEMERRKQGEVEQIPALAAWAPLPRRY